MKISQRKSEHDEKPVDRDAQIGDVIAVVDFHIGCQFQHKYYLVIGVPRDVGVVVLPLDRHMSSVVGLATAFGYDQLNTIGAGYVMLSGHCVANLAHSVIALGIRRVAEELLRRSIEANLFKKATHCEYLP